MEFTCFVQNDLEIILYETPSSYLLRLLLRSSLCLAAMHSLCLGVPLRWSMSCRCHTGSACRWGWYSCIYKAPVGLVFYRLQCRCRYNGYCLPRGLQVPSSYFVGLAFLWEVHVLGCPCVSDATPAALVGGCSDATWRCGFYC